MRPAIFCSVRVIIWSEDELIPISKKEWVFLSHSQIPSFAVGDCLPVGRGKGWGEGWGEGTKKIRYPMIFSPCINKEKETVKCVGLNLDSSPGVKCRHVLHERPLSSILL